MSKHVRYGDQVYIEISDLLPPPSTDTRLLCANGFLEETVFGVKAQDYRKSNFRNCIFTIRPSLVDAKEDLHALNSLKTELSFLSLSKPDTLGEKCLSQEISFKEQQIEQAKDNLEALNKKILQEMDGQCVRYGSVILLEHVESGYYLCAESSYHPNNPSLYNMKLRSDITTSCHFKFYSYISTSDRSEIDYESEMKLVSAHLNRVVTMGDIRNNIDGIGLNTEDDEPEDLKKPNFPAEDIRRENILTSFGMIPLAIGTALESIDNNRVKLVEYCSREDLIAFAKRKTIKNGDYVRFQIDDFYLTVSSTILRQNFNLVEQKSEGYPYNFINTIFQIVKVNQEYDYPRGTEIQSNPKKTNEEDEEEVGKFYLKHLISGHYLALPEVKLYKDEDTNLEDSEKPLNPPYFQFVNNHLNQKSSLTRNSRIALKAFQGNDVVGQYYLESDVEKYQVLQADMNTKYFIGFRHAEDKIKSKLKLVKKSIIGNKAVGSFFRVTLVSDEERKKILELESYAKALKHFMRVLTSIMQNKGKVTPSIFENELIKVLKISERLISLTESHDKSTQILIREFKVLDTIAKLFCYFFVNPNIKHVMEEKRFETEEVIKFLKYLCTLVLAVTKGNELNDTYFAQYVRTFILCLLGPSPFLEYCKNSETERLKDIIVILLEKILGEKDLDTFGQFVFYETKVFGKLDVQKDYSVHILKVMNHYFKNKAPNLQNSLRDNFISKYVGNPERVRKIFPKITFNETEQDFEINFPRESYPETIFISKAPPEVINYLIWVFQIISSTAKVRSLRFWNIIINYYSQDICGAMLASSKIPPKLKNSILDVVRVVHSAFSKLPFDKLSQKIQILLNPSEIEQWLEAYDAKIQDAEVNLISPEEESRLLIKRLDSSDKSVGVDIKKLSLELLKEGVQQIQNNNLESLQFILQVMIDLLNDEDIEDESLCIVHHSIATLIHNLAEELSTQKKGIYHEACMSNIDRIFNLLLMVDKHVGRRAFQESIWLLKDKTLKGYMKTRKSIQSVISASENNQAEELKEIKESLDSMAEEWKSKKKLYESVKRPVDETVFLEETIMKDLWKIVQSAEDEVTFAIINLIKQKTNFEAKVRKQLFECALIAEHKEIQNFEDLTSSLLTLNNIARRIKFKIEFDLEQKEDEKALDEILTNLENIFLIIYDFEQHMEEEEQGLMPETARELFLKRFYYCKVIAKNEIPFKYKSHCIKKFYQKILNVLQAHEIIFPFIKYLFSHKTFSSSNDDKFKYGYRLVMVISILFMHKNTVNQNLMSKYPDFITTFYDSDIEHSSVESIFMFTEMCRGNKSLLRLGEDYLFSVATYTFVEFYNTFNSKSEALAAANYIRSLPVIYSCEIPKDMFDPAQFMTNVFFNFLNSMITDNQLSLMNLVKLRPTETSPNSTEVNMLTELADSTQNILEMPPLYSILRELLEAQREFALTEVKERVLVLQNSFTLERVLPFLKNENIEFNFELKRLLLQTVENIFFKNTYRNTNIFLDYNHFTSFLSVLLIDVYGYLKYRIEADDEIFEIFKTSYFSSEDSTEYFVRYDKYLTADLDNVVFLQYQSLISYIGVWKKYIYYLLCDFIGTILTHFKDFMLVTKEKGQKYSNIFEMWFKLVLKIRSIDTDDVTRSQLDEVLKNTVVHSEYAHRRELVYSTLENAIKRLGTYRVEKALRKTSLNTDIDNLISTWIGSKSEYKPVYAETNLSHIVETLGLNKPVIKRLIDTLLIPETPTKDTLLILKLLRKLIEVENTTEENKNQPIYLWSDVSEVEFNNIHAIQEELVGLGVVNAIFALLYQYQLDKVVVHEVLLLCIALLFGGNETVQDAFYEQFRDDWDNEILSNFAQILEEVLETFRFKESKRTQEFYLKALQTIFNYLINHPTSAAAISDGPLTVPDDLKESLALAYKKEVINKSMDDINDYNILLIMCEFLQTLCEGHYLNFQVFLRDQTLVNHSKSSNIPEFLIHAYHIYYKYVNVINVEIGIKILDLLIEIQQGESAENSVVLLQKTFLNDLCNTLTGFSTNLDLLARGFEFEAGHARFTDIKCKVLTLLKDLVERSDSVQLEQIRQYVSLTALVSTFKENIIAFHKRKGSYPKKESLTAEDMWDPNLSSAYTVYFILKYLSIDEPSNEFAPEIQEALKMTLENGKGISADLANKYLHQFFKKFTGSVEIYEKRLNKLMRIYFPISVVYSYIKQDTKVEFANTVDRSSLQAKIADFMDATTELIGLAFVEYNSRQRFLGLNFYNAYNWLRLATNILSIIVVLFDVLRLEYTEDEVKYKNEGDVRIQYLLCVVQSFLSFSLIILWVPTRLGRTLAGKWDEFVRDNVKEMGQLPQDVVKKLNGKGLNGKEELTEDVGEAVLLLKGPYSEEWKKVESFMSNKRTLYDLLFTIKSGALLWHLTYFAICIASNFHPIAAALQLFDIIIRSDTVSRIAMSVSRNIGQFMWTLVLLVVTVYVYSLLGIYFFHSRYDAGEEGGDMCQDAFSCYLGNLNFGLRSGGGIADVINKVPYDPEEKGTYLVHTLYDLSFFILIITLLLNLIFGMIIDAFGDLRDEKSSNDEDMKNVCFICGLTRSEYERTSDFEAHISEDHNMWRYFAYLIYLTEKSKAFVTELTDIEDYVLDRYRKGDHIWVPMGRSLTLESHFAKEEKEKKSEIDILKDELLHAISEVKEQNQELMVRMSQSHDGLNQSPLLKRPISITNPYSFKSPSLNKSKML